jgi:hypothetical protein
VELAGEAPPLRSAAACLVAVALLTSSTAAAQAAATEQQAEAREQWTLSPLVKLGSDAPGGGRFEEIGAVSWSLGRVLVFWARVGAERWGIYSWKSGAPLRLVAPEGKESRSPNAEGIVEPLAIRRRLGLRRPTRILPGGKLHYIVTTPGLVGTRSDVYGWDGERLRKVLTEGDRIEVFGGSYTLRAADVEFTAPDGRAVVRFETDKPRQLQGYGWHDGDRLVTLVVLGESLPGAPTLRAAPEGRALRQSLFDAGRVVFAAGALFVDVEVLGAPYKYALFRLTPDRAEKILAVGDVLPVAPALKVIGVSPPVLLGDDRVLVLAQVESSASVLLSYRDGQFEKLVELGPQHPLEPSRSLSVTGWQANASKQVVFFVTAREPGAKTGLPEVLFWSDGRFRVVAQAGGREKYGVLGMGGGALESFEGAGFLRDDGPYYAFFWNREQVRSKPSGGYRTITITTETTKFRQLQIFDGEKANVMKSVTLRRHQGRFRGWSIDDVGFLSASAEKLDFESLPHLETLDGQRISPLDVVTWAGSDEALVRLNDGIYLCSRAR